MSKQQPVQNLSQNTEANAQYATGIVDIWDTLIDWEGRASSEGDFFETLLRASNAKTVLDAACGTGYHTVALLDAGFDVVASDSSSTMLERARENFSARGLDTSLVQADWRQLTRQFNTQFDAILCLGSSFPHLLTKADRSRAMEQFYAMLNPGGILVVDHRNFDALLAGQFSGKGQLYYCGKSVKVSASLTDDGLAELTYTEKQKHKLRVYPITYAEIQQLLRDTGFSGLHLYGDFQKNTITSDTDFIIHVAVKAH